MGIIRSVQIIHCGDPCKTVPLLSRLTRHEMSHWQEAVAANTYSAQHAGGEEDSFRTLQHLQLFTTGEQAEFFETLSCSVCKVNIKDR